LANPSSSPFLASVFFSAFLSLLPKEAAGALEFELEEVLGGKIAYQEEFEGFGDLAFK
jgi:hypothetical protein